jgi:hypothetical protein
MTTLFLTTIVISREYLLIDALQRPSSIYVLEFCLVLTKVICLAVSCISTRLQRSLIPLKVDGV